MMSWVTRYRLFRLARRARPDREFVLSLAQTLRERGYLSSTSTFVAVRPVWKMAAVSLVVLLSVISMATVKQSFFKRSVSTSGQQGNSIAISPLATTPVISPEVASTPEPNATELISESGFDPNDLWREQQVANLVEQQAQEFDYEEARLRQQVEAEMRLE